jgi:tetratricopeptide (TPR) repeat protein
MKAAYLAAIQTGNRESFAQKYISNPLGGSVFLELGDEAYQKKEYQRAMDCYHHAHVSLGNNIFGGRAAIGEGITFMKLGNYAKGEAIFAEITEEKSYPPLIRGHAMYLLANGLYERQEFSKAKGTLNQLINSNFSSQWKAAARALLQEIETVQ